MLRNEAETTTGRKGTKKEGDTCRPMAGQCGKGLFCDPFDWTCTRKNP